MPAAPSQKKNEKSFIFNIYLMQLRKITFFIQITINKKMAGGTGLEPVTNGFGDRRSTN